MRHAADNRFRLPYAEFLPEEGQARGVQIDIAADMLGLRYPMEVNLMGDAAQTLDALLPLIEHKTRRSWRTKVEGWRKAWDKKLTQRALSKAAPINPQRVVHELSPRLPDAAIITCDSGSCANWFARDLRIRPGMECSLSGAWLRWARQCPTPSQPSSLTPSAAWWPW